MNFVMFDYSKRKVFLDHLYTCFVGKREREKKKRILK